MSQANLEAAAAQLPPGATPAMAEIASTRNAICNTRPTPSAAA